MLDRFIRSGTEDLETALRRRRETTFRMYQEEAFNAVDATIAEMAEYVKQKRRAQAGFQGTN